MYRPVMKTVIHSPVTRRFPGLVLTLSDIYPPLLKML